MALDEVVPDGFTRAGDRRWVSEPRGAVRTLVEFQALKGAQYSAKWGFSVEFVPRLRANRLAWKRTVRTATFDLTIDPVDSVGAVPQWCSLRADADARRAEAVALRVWQAAAEDFAAVTNTVDLLALFERRSRMTFRRFGLENKVQTDLAWGLLRIAHGDRGEGDAQLARFCARFNIPLSDPVLAKARAEARTLADLSWMPAE